ncbi:hypothetical protein GCM10025868_05770 [Angustibacter aerolatus]|uniref:CTP synthase N-terminal domain-containing protein n=1 Tax=Angustibacter aerolatus TaxID=1162965 RepID=A0ABQ6JC24_9ACTN|nr:hypothetical protein GCM10025868_05770 [Angustibacter aerolatus]
MPAGDPEALAEVLARLLRDPAARAEPGERAARRAAEPARRRGRPRRRRRGLPARRVPRGPRDRVLSNSVAQTKHIFVTGGVASSLGKGLTASSLGLLLRSRGLRVTMQKLDPYLNVDPGTMNPFQHGEVFVTDDGAETDLDIGHYERFLDAPLDAAANVTTGQIYSEVIAKERRGEYLGDTVQVIPHITNEIKRRMRAQASDDVDVIITEIGGTVGDIESLPFLEAARQVRHDVGRDNVFFLHVSLVPYLAPSGEPEDEADAALGGRAAPGRHPARRAGGAQRPPGAAGDEAQDRDEPATSTARPWRTPSTRRPSTTSRRCCTAKASTRTSSGGSAWPSATSTGRSGTSLLRRVHEPEHQVEVALVGKYIDLPDAYLSVTEALRAGGFSQDARVRLRWVASDECQTPEGAQRALAGVDAVCVPGGFGVRGIEGKARRAALVARAPGADARPVPRPAVHGHRVRARRRRAGRRVVDRVRPRRAAPGDRHDGGAEGDRVGRGRPRRHHAARPVPGGARPGLRGRRGLRQRAWSTSGTGTATRSTTPTASRLEEAGLVFSGTSPDGGLVEFVEPPREVHPYYVSTQAHPEFRSRPGRAHPLFAGLVAAAVDAQRAARLIEVERRHEVAATA